MTYEPYGAYIEPGASRFFVNSNESHRFVGYSKKEK